MAILEEHFYHKTTHLYTAVFGTIFNNIKILRDDGKEIRVPLAYSGQDKNNVRLEQNENPDEVKYKMRLPRIGYRITDIIKDESRITNRNYQLLDATIDRTGATQTVSQYNRIPFNFGYLLSIKTKTMDDLLQMFEQVVVQFNPAIQIIVEDNPDISGTTALNVRLDSASIEDQFEGEYEAGRILEANLQFTLEGYLYMPSSNSGIINTVYVNYRDLVNPDDILEQDVFTEDDL